MIYAYSLPVLLQSKWREQKKKTDRCVDYLPNHNALYESIENATLLAV